MEDLVNPLFSDLPDYYPIYENEVRCCAQGIWFGEREHKHFDIKGKIEKLDGIINNIMNKLNNISYDNKENLFDTMTTKKNMLADLSQKYKEKEKNYIEADKFYREELFIFYRIKYNNTSEFAFSESKMYLSIMNDIQSLLRDKFRGFLNDYQDIRNSFFDINNYIIKIKKLFDIKN